MNDLQKKFAIVGLTAFIVWFFLAMGNDAFSHLSDGNFHIFFNTAIYTNFDNVNYPATWPNLLSFITWVGSFFAFFIYKD
ncbi:hypothetical protein OAQ61_02590 [Candidatus Marinimicrobia bacterium]|nr:hypothetical protein [Candidatus Neomarinimicrobiota bacterium]